MAALLSVGGGQETLELHRERQSATDLAVAGLVSDISPGEQGFLRWSDLRRLPTTKLKLTGEFVPGEQEVTVVYLSDLWGALPHDARADVLLARCADGYASVYRESFIAEFKPFLILEINGQGPDSWPPPGLKFNPGPYVISVSTDVAHAVATLLDAGHKRPWGVTSIEVASFAERFGGIFADAFASLSARAQSGREIWINSCASCHEGPAGTFGGRKSNRPFEFVAAQAKHNRDYFKTYVRDPKSLVSIATMEPHPHYTDANLDALVAFLTAERAP